MTPVLSRPPARIMTAIIEITAPGLPLIGQRKEFLPDPQTLIPADRVTVATGRPDIVDGGGHKVLEAHTLLSFRNAN